MCGGSRGARTGVRAGRGERADAPQQVTDSAAAAQVGATEVAPAVAVSGLAPVTANAPVTVASPDSGGDAAQSGGSSADASSAGTSGGGDQDVSGSSGSAQVGSATRRRARQQPLRTCERAGHRASPDSGGDATSPGGTATAEPSEDGGSGDQDAGDSTGALQLEPPRLTPGLTANTPVTGNTPITILSPGSGGDSTGPGGDTPPGDDTPTDPDDTPPTDPGPDSPPQGSPPPGGDDDTDAGAGGGGGGGPSGGDPSRGRQGELAGQPGIAHRHERREFGAQAGDLPFTGLLLWLVALLGVVALTARNGRRQLTTA